MIPQPIAVEDVRCQGCGAAGPYTAIATGPDYDNHACGDQEFNLVQCPACCTYFLNPRPTAAMLPRIYSSDSYYAYRFSSQGNPTVLHARQRRDRAKAAQALKHGARSPRDMTVLDIGAGDGALLEAFAAAGVPAAQLAGLDIDPGAVERLDRRGFEGILGRVEDVDVGEKRFDVIAMIQVIEHVAEPVKIINKCRAALRPGGVLLIETPNMASWDRFFFKRRLWGGYHFPRHWTLWDKRSLTRLLQAHGFTVDHVSTPAAAVIWSWSLNHGAQYVGAPPWVANFFGMNNPAMLGVLWVLELLPSLTGQSANMRLLARLP